MARAIHRRREQDEEEEVLLSSLLCYRGASFCEDVSSLDRAQISPRYEAEIYCQASVSDLVVPLKDGATAVVLSPHFVDMMSCFDPRK